MGYAGKIVVVVSHVTLMRGLLIHLGYADYHQISREGMANSSHILIESDGTDFFLKETLGITKKLVK